MELTNRFRGCLLGLAVTRLARYENGQIQQKASAENLMDYGPLDDMLKNKRAR